MNRWFVGLMAVLFIIQGCAFLSYEVFSTPESEGASREREKGVFDHGGVVKGPDETIQFALSGIGLSVGARNFQEAGVSFGIFPLPVIPWPPGIIDIFYLPREAPPPLFIEIHLNPESEGFTLDPMRVTLVTSKKETINPVGFIGPVYAIRNIKKLKCQWDNTLKDNAQVIHLDQWTCFKLKFEISHVKIEWANI